MPTPDEAKPNPDATPDEATSEASDPTPGASEAERRALRRQLVLLITPIVMFTIAAKIADAFAPTLLVNTPLLLITLNSRLRYLVLASPNLNVFAFFAIPLIRYAAIASLYFIVGRRYGERAVRWLEQSDVGSSGPILRIVRWVERQFGRARIPVLVLLPGYPLVLMLAGASSMTVLSFGLTVGATMVVRLVLVRFVAGEFSGVILDITDWIAQYQWWLTGLSIAMVVGFVMWGQRSGRHPLESIDKIVDDLDKPVGPG